MRAMAGSGVPVSLTVVVVCCGLLGCPPASEPIPEGCGRLHITNLSADYRIVAIALWTPHDSDWGPNLLTSSLEPDDSAYFDIETQMLLPYPFLLAVCDVEIRYQPLNDREPPQRLVYEDIWIHDGEEYRIWFRGPLE